MYLPLEDKKTIPFYDVLCDDVLGHVISFLGDEEKAEWCYVNSTLRQLICDHSPQTYIPICERCHHYIKRCTCPKKTKCCKAVVSGIVVWLFLLLVASFVVAIVGYHRGWF